MLIFKQCVKGATLKKREDSCEKSGSKGIIIRSGMLLKVWKVVSVVNKRASSSSSSSNDSMMNGRPSHQWVAEPPTKHPAHWRFRSRVEFVVMFLGFSVW